MSGKRTRQQLKKHLSPSRSSREDESERPSTSTASAIYMTDDESNESAEEIVVEPDHHLSFEDILHDQVIYQPSPSSERIILSRDADLMCLNGRAYLNDNIIAFYLTYLKYQHPNGDKIHLFDTLFFAEMLKVQDRIKGDPSRSNHLYEESYDEVAKWTSNIDIFQFDFLIVPIFKDKHWSVAFVCYPGKLSQIEPVIDLERSNERACIVFFDSLNKISAPVLKQYAQSLKTFVQHELFKKKKKKKRSDAAKLLTNDDLPVLNPQVPAQTTDYDCGIFLLHYVEKFLEDPGVIFNSKRLAKVQLNNWFDPDDLVTKRTEIATLIQDVYKKSDKSMYGSQELQLDDISVLSENVSNQATSKSGDLSGTTGCTESTKKCREKFVQMFGKDAPIPIYECSSAGPSNRLDAPSNRFDEDLFSIFDEPFSSVSMTTNKREPDHPRELKVSRRPTKIDDLIDLSSETSPSKDERCFTPLRRPTKKAKTSHYLPSDFEGLVNLDCEDEEDE